MKILLKSNKEIVWTIIVVSAILITLGILINIIVFKDDQIITAYHQSRWNNYSPEIEIAIKNLGKLKPIELVHIQGGIVSHDIPTTLSKLTEFYSRLKLNQNIKNFIVIGPDHTNAGKNQLTVSNASFFTLFGEMRPIPGLAIKLQKASVANIEEDPFDLEHSIGSQMLVISKIFPEARVTPVIVRSDTTIDQARSLGETLAKLVDDDTVVIASIDFSHYLSTDQAKNVDQISGQIVKNLDSVSVSLIKVDSEKTFLIFSEIMHIRKALSVDGFEVLNTNDFVQNSDNTTGYIFGYWGTH